MGETFARALSSIVLSSYKLLRYSVPLELRTSSWELELVEKGWSLSRAPSQLSRNRNFSSSRSNDIWRTRVIWCVSLNHHAYSVLSWITERSSRQLTRYAATPLNRPTGVLHVHFRALVIHSVGWRHGRVRNISLYRPFVCRPRVFQSFPSIFDTSWHRPRGMASLICSMCSLAH